MAKSYIKQGSNFYTDSGQGEFHLVQDSETQKGLKTGLIPYQSVAIDRPLTFSSGQNMSSQQSPYYQQTNTQNLNQGGTEAPASTSLGGGQDFGTMLKAKFMETMNALTNSKVPGLEARQREQLTRKLTAPATDYTNMAPQDIIRSANARGSEYDPAIEQTTRDIAQEKSFGNEKLQSLNVLANLMKTLSPESQQKTSDILNYEYEQLNPAFKAWQTEDSNRKAKANGLTPYQQFQSEQSLANTFTKNTANGREVSRQFSTMKTAVDALNKGEAGLNETTQAVIRTYNLILEPDSVVREAEYALTSGGQSMLRNLDGMFTKISAGGSGITVQSLNDFVKLAEKFYSNAQRSYIEEAQRIKTVAKNNNLNLKNILTSSNLNIAETGQFDNQFQQKNHQQEQSSKTVEYPKGSGEFYSVDTQGNMTPQ